MSTRPLRLLTQAEVARELGLSKPRIWQLVEEGRIPKPAAYYQGAAPLWDPETVAAWKAQRAARLESCSTTEREAR